jgi:hypothetical protein
MQAIRASLIVAIGAAAIAPWSQVRAVGFCPSGFQGNCAPANWTVQQPGNGSVDFLAAPINAILTSNDDSAPGNTFVSIEIQGDNEGIVSFSYFYTTNDQDGAQFDPFGYLLNGAPIQLVPPPSLANGESVSGSFSFQISAGDTFGFYAESTDNALGPSVTEITDFMYVPIPGPLPVLGLGAAFGFSRKLRKRIKLSAARQHQSSGQ